MCLKCANCSKCGNKGWYQTPNGTVVSCACGGKGSNVHPTSEELNGK